MRFPSRLFALACLLALAGCGETVRLPDEAPSRVPGPHQGTALKLPENPGYIELLNDPPVDLRTEGPTAIVAYFLQEDGQQPLAGSPSDVKFQIDANRKSTTVDLKPSSEPHRFASDQGPYNLKMIRGKLTGKIDGKPFELEVFETR